MLRKIILASKSKVRHKIFKTKDKKELDFETPTRPIKEGKKIAIKVIDIFGNDTMKILKI